MGFRPYQCRHHGEININLIILVVLHLALNLLMVMVVWVLVIPTFPIINMFVGLIVLILYHLRVVIIHPWVIQIKTGPIIFHIRGGRIILAMLVMIEVLLILWPPTSPSRKFILADIGTTMCLGHLIFIVIYSLWCHLVVGIIHSNLTILINSVLPMVVL